METKSTARLNFARVPAMFLQAGFPLKLTLYRYSPATSGLTVLGNRGEVLDVSSFLEINRSSDTLILVLHAELKLLLAQPATEWESYDQIAEAA